MRINKLWLWVGLLLLGSCSSAGPPEKPWPPTEPRQPERLVLLAPGELDGLQWWRTNIFSGLANNGRQDEVERQYVKAMLAQTNAVRAANGVAPVELLDSLSAVAQAHALDQATRDYWAHPTPEGLSSRDRVEAASGLIVTVGGENSSIGYQGDETAESMVWSWEHHAGHRDLLLDPDIKFMGGGRAQYSRKEPLFVTQLLVSFDAE